MIADDPHLSVRLAASEADLRAAQRLRYDIFVTELGGGGPGVRHSEGLESDHFDTFCDHLVLVDDRRDFAAHEHVVGVYRIMREDQARRAGGFYSAGEYDLSVLLRSGRRLLELGRSCVHPEFRGGAGMLRLWSGLADYVARHEIEVLFGVASFHGTDAKALVAPLSYLHHKHIAPPDLRVTALPEGRLDLPLIPLADINRPAAMKATPALIKAYLRLGGYVGEGAFVDRVFNTTDVCLVMDTRRMTAEARARYGAASA